MPLTQWTRIRKSRRGKQIKTYKVRFFFLFLCSNLLTSLHSYNDKEVPSFLFGTTRRVFPFVPSPGGQGKDMEGLDLCHPTLRNSITVLCHQNIETAGISMNSSSPFPTTNTSKRETGWFFAPPPADIYCHYVAGLVGEGLSRLFFKSSKEAWLAHQLSNLLKLLLFVRDYDEDCDDRRYFWLREILRRKNMGLKDLCATDEETATMGLDM